MKKHVPTVLAVRPDKELQPGWPAADNGLEISHFMRKLLVQRHLDPGLPGLLREDLHALFSGR